MKIGDDPRLKPLPPREPPGEPEITSRMYKTGDGKLIEFDTMVLPRNVWRRLPEARDGRWDASVVDGKPNLVLAVRIMV